MPTAARIAWLTLMLFGCGGNDACEQDAVNARGTCEARCQSDRSLCEGECIDEEQICLDACTDVPCRETCTETRGTCLRTCDDIDDDCRGTCADIEATAFEACGMRTVLFASLALLASPALAQDPEPRHVVSVSGQAGLDFPINQVWAGPELAVYPVQERGLAGQFLFAPVFSISDATAMVVLEGGGTVVVPTPDSPGTTVRLGLWGRAVMPFVTYPLPVRAGAVGSLGTGIIPSGGALLEFGWKARPFKTDFDKAEADKRWSPASALGIRVGPGSEIGGCLPDESFDDCVLWNVGLTFQAYTRVDLRSGLHLEARIGTGFSLAIGRTLGRGRDGTGQ